MRKRKRYPFIPRDAWNWKEVMDVTGGLGIAPFKGKSSVTEKTIFVEYEEYKSNIPKPLKRLNSPYAPDKVAAMLELEDSEALYRWLEFKQPPMTQAEYHQEQAEEFLERKEDELNYTKEMIRIMGNENDERYNCLPADVDEKVKAAKQYLEKNPTVARKTLSSGTSKVKRVRIGAPMIAKYLGRNWNLTKVQESLMRINLIDKGIIDPEALYLLPTAAATINFAKAVKKFGVKKQFQGKIAIKLLNSETYGKRAIMNTIMEFYPLDKSEVDSPARAVFCDIQLKKSASLINKTVKMLKALFRDKTKEERISDDAIKSFERSLNKFSKCLDEISPLIKVEKRKAEEFLKREEKREEMHHLTKRIEQFKKQTKKWKY